MNPGFRNDVKKTALTFLQRACLLVLLCAAGSAGAQNQSLKLDGKGSYVELPPNIFKDLTQCTVEVWVKWDAFENYSRVCEFGASWQSMCLFNERATSNLRFNFYPQNAKFKSAWQHTITATNLLRTNEWIHVAAVTGPGGMLLYANGRLVGQHTNTASFADLKAFQTNYLGHGMSGVPTDRDFRGEIDEVRIWNHRRTVAQIRENMFKQLSGKEQGLAHLWNFEDGTANDSAPAGAHGKFTGQAQVASSDLGLVSEPMAAAPTPDSKAAALPSTGADPPRTAATVGSNTAAWWVAGALSLLVALLAWLVLMLRRSGVGSAKLVDAPPAHALLSVGAKLSGTVTAADHEQMKERALAELTSFAKESLVQGLYSQRATLLEAQKQAQQELAELETRLMTLRLPERIQAYEQRILELERQLEMRGEEFRELGNATLRALRQKLEQEKQKSASPSRFN